jgi:DNA-directed RNA polymerase specialized sigma subunit
VALDDAGRELVIRFQSLARSLAYRYLQKAPAGDLDELTSIAYGGLVEACERYPAYCAERGFDPECTDYLPAYVSRRINGALLDASRAADHLTRSDRNIQKSLAEFEDRGLDRAAQAKAAGVTAREADRVRAAQNARATSLDQGPGGADDEAGAVGDEHAGTESTAVVSSVLASAMNIMTRVLDGRSCLAVALRYYWRLDVPGIAAVLGTDEELAGKLLETAVVELHQGMLKAAS